MNNKGYISKLKKGSSLYESLHEEALEILQKLSGGVWTDYNEHDPGVTLLENIAYAITEIAHKIKLPVQDILQSSKGRPLVSGDNGLFTASDILTTNPVTFNDYRKLWIDQVTNVKNVWIKPVTTGDTALDTIKGLLQVYVEKYEYQSNSAEEISENKRITNEIHHLYNTHRNLCERLHSIEVYRSLTFKVDLKITLLDLVDSEEVLARILYKINDYLAPEVGYYALRQLQNEALDTNTIFNGPLLSNGFIKDEDLKEPLQIIEVSEIIKRISKISGVVTINDFQLHYVDTASQTQHSIRERFEMPKHTTARVLFPETNDGLIFENSGVSFKPDLKATKKQLAFIQALDASKFKAASNSLNSIPIPEGQVQDINYHFPIRKQLPEIYGVGDRGIGSKATALRQAQVKQLQGYLLPFDQVIINFLAQLSHIYTLYDVANNTEKSYFTNTLPDAKVLLELLAPPAMYNVDTDTEILNYWTQVTHNLNALFDEHAPERLDKIADHLLARHSETFKTFALFKINTTSYGSAMPATHFKDKSLAVKQELVKNYAAISYNRSKSFNYHSAALLPDNKTQQDTPGILKKIALLMGIANFEIKPLSQTIADSGIHIHPEALEIDVVIEALTLVTPKETPITVTSKTVNIKEDVQENLRCYMHYVGDKDSILEYVLREGILAERYKIVQADRKKTQYHVLHHTTNGTAYVAHSTKTKTEAQQAIHKTIAYLVDLSQKSEGFFMLEHVLLLPAYSGKHFGFTVDFSQINSKLDLIFTHPETATFAVRNANVTSLLEGILEHRLQFESHKEASGYTISLKGANGERLAVSQQSFPSEALVSQYLKDLQQEDFAYDIADLEAATSCYVYYDTHPVNESFFTFRLSFILPSWPVRFQNENFRNSFENTCYEEVPIHIHASTYWMDYKHMHLFETFYFRWLAVLQHGNASKDFTYNAYELIKLLQTLTPSH